MSEFERGRRLGLIIGEGRALKVNIETLDPTIFAGGLHLYGDDKADSPLNRNLQIASLLIRYLDVLAGGPK